LAATAAFRAGAGLVTIVTGSAEVRELLVACRPELMVAAPPDQSPMLAGVDAWVVGPGLTDPLAAAGLSAFYGTDPQPAVWDASALDQLPLGVLPTGPRVITPHPGEAARLLARAEADDTWSSGRVQHGRIDAARRLAERTGAVAVLKGEGTLVAAPDGTCHVAVVGGPALATAGSGDCLAGLIGALLARGLPPFDAACAAVHVHGLAGEQAAERFAYPRAGDIADAVDDVMRSERLARPVARWPRMRYG
jgi:NAD(P)H-hydrate epimerase